MTKQTMISSSLETQVAQRCDIKSQSAASSLNVFVRLPHQQNRTVPLTLTGQQTSVEELCSQVHKVTRFPNNQIVRLTLRGNPLKSVNQVRQNDTLVATVGGLPGGSFATLVSKNLSSLPIVDNGKAITFGMMKDIFESEYPSTKEKTYTYTYTINEVEAEVPEDVESEDYANFIARLVTDMDHELGNEIKVVRTCKEDEANDKKSTHLPADQQFLKNIPCFEKQGASDKLRKKLSADQKQLMENYVNRQMEPENLNLILTTMTNDQIDNLLLVFQANKKYKMNILMYLLKKAGQWTDISETMIKNANEDTKTLQIRRLINGLNNSFSPTDENDKMITELLAEEQSNMLETIIVNMSSVQRIELLMQILEPEQRPQLMDCLRPGDVRSFWPLLLKERRMEIFAALSPTTRFQYLTFKDYLTSDLKIRLWDNIGKDSRLEIWNSVRQNDDIVRQCVEGQIEEETNFQQINTIVNRRSTLVKDKKAAKGKKAANISSAAKKAVEEEIDTNIGALKSQQSQSKDEKIFQLERNLLDMMTVSQRSRLWSNLDTAAQKKMMEHVLSDDNMAVEFWNTLNHDRRCHMIDQLEEEHIFKLFKAMKDLENRTQLGMMLNRAVQKNLLALLTPDEREELFLFGHFEEREFTSKTSKEFIDSLLEDYYAQNNQVVPFDKIEGGYIQCIANPNVQNGYITVQIVEPRYKVDNKLVQMSKDFSERELETDEARSIGASKNQHNDQFRFTQNLYGELQETEPNQARNARYLGVISFFEYSPEQGMQCKHSFFAPNPVIFKRSGKSAQELVLYTGHNGDVFFFNKKEAGASTDAEQESEHFDLCLQILNRDQNAERGELSRETSESCFTYRIDPTSKLFDLLMEGRFVMKKYTEVFLLNSIPTMIQSGNNKLVVFSHCNAADQGPALYLYDVNMTKEIKRVQGGEALIDFYPDSKAGCCKGKLTMLGNKEIMSDKIWKTGGDKNDTIQKEHAAKYETCADPLRQTAIVITIEIDLENEEFDVLPHSDGSLINDDNMPKVTLENRDKGIPSSEMGAWMPKIANTEAVVVLDLKDIDKNFSQRYLRQTPTQIIPHERHPETHRPQSFTILFHDLQSFTFSYIQTFGEMTEAKRVDTQSKVDAINKVIAKLKDEGDKNGDLAQNVEEQETIKKKHWEDAIPKLYYYKCKYVVPEASSIVYDRRIKDSVKFFVQVSNRNERAQQKARDNLRDVNQFELTLYNISDLRIKPDAIERIPNESETRKIKVPMSRDALLTYSKNMYANKFGECFIKTIATPVLFHYSAYAGGFLYQNKEENMIKPMLDWYVVPTARQSLPTVVRPIQQSVQVDYPLMVYKGFVPDNRELVMVNLADKSNPQKIMHLYDMQFICFVGHSFSDREAKIGMLCMEQNDVKLCWFVCKQPYMKREICELSHMMLHKQSIEFNVPILDQMGDIQRAEFVSSLGRSGIEDSIFGALIIQTKNEIWFSSNASGKCDRITGGTMKPLELQRGFNSVFYFVQSIGETDSIVNELKLNMVSGEWETQILEIHKVAEGRVIALEIDAENFSRTDSAYNYKDQLVEQVPDVLNMFYVIDDKENMWKIRQKSEEESGARYEVIQEINLTLGKELTMELNNFKQKDFNRIAITERCLTVNNKNFNFFNGHVWTLDVNKNTEQIDEFEANEDGQKRHFAEVLKIQSMSWTSRQLISCVYQDYDQVRNRWVDSCAFTTKLQPGSRRQDLVGLRGLRDMESINLISNDQYLMKFKGSDLSGTQDYWTVIDKFGQIRDIPDKTKDILIWSNFSSGQSRQKSTGVTIILRGGQERIISFEADVAYVERKMTKIEFNRTGEVTAIKEFKKFIYDDKLRQCIIEDLLDNQIEVKGRKSKLTKEDATKIAKTLEYQDSVLCTKEGDLYRIASIIDPGFDDEVAVNPLDDDDGNIKVLSDSLSMGIFLVKSKAKRETLSNPNSKIVKDEKELKIILFLCQTRRDRLQLDTAGFSICGKFLCWSYPEEKVVHILNMGAMNRTGTEDATQTVSRAVNQAFGNLLGAGGLAGMMALPSNQPNQQATVTEVKPKEAIQSAKPAQDRSGSVKSAASRSNSVKRPPSKTGANKMKTAANASRASTRSGTVKKTQKKSQFAINDSLVSSNGSLLLAQTQDDDDFMPIKGSIIEQPDVQLLSLTRKLSMESVEEPRGTDFVSRIRWKKFVTRAIDLRVMCEADSDKLGMILTEVPKTTQFSVMKDRSENEADSGYSYKQGLRDSLLQITIRDRTIVYDLDPVEKKNKAKEEAEEEAEGVEGKAPKELFLLNATSHFIPLHKYVEVGLKLIKCKENLNSEGYLVDQVITNRCKDSCLYRQDRLVILDKELTEQEKSKRNNQPKPPICRGIFKKFAEIDLQELNRIQDKVTRQARLDNIDFQTILSTYQGHTAFSIFANDVKFHEQVLIQIQEGDWMEEEQEDESILENNELRRLFRILTLPTPDILEKSLKDQPQNGPPPGLQSQQTQIEEQKGSGLPQADDDEFLKQESMISINQDATLTEKVNIGTKQGLDSVLQKSLYSKSSRIKDCLLSIANRCADCTITSFCANQDDFQCLLKNLTTQAIELIQESFVLTPFTSMIVNVPWGPEVPLITFRKQNSLITQEECEKEIRNKLSKDYSIQESEFTKAQVDVRLLDLTWLLSDRRNFINFVGTLEDASNDQIYNTELISTLLDNFWEENYKKILKYCLIPWGIYAFCTMWFFVQSLQEEHNDYFTRILGLACLVGLGYQISIEWRQNVGSDSLEYFQDFVQMLDLFQITTSLWIIVMGVLGIEFPSYETQRVIAALATLCLWIKVLDWCKLFGPTSFFIKLIIETIIDIKYFMIIFTVALMMFGMPLYILQLNRTQDNAVVSETFGGFWFLNAFYNQYMLSLGEFNYGNYESGPQTYLCFAFFLCATFLTQITFLNMLIALMGDTFAKVMEQKEQFGLQTKLNIMSDYTALVLDKNADQDPMRYMFVITQKTEGTDDPNAAWEGNLSVIKKSVEKGLSTLQKNMDRKLNLVQSQNMEAKTRDLINDKDSRGQYLRIMEKFATVDNRFNAIDVEKTDKIFEIVRKSQQEQRGGIRELADTSKTNQEEQNEMQARNEHQIAELARLSKSSNERFFSELEQLQEKQTILVNSQEEIKQVVSNQEGGAGQQPKNSESATADAEAMTMQIEEAKKAISEASQNSSQAIAKLEVQQDLMLQKIDTLETRHDELYQSISNNHTALSQFHQAQNEVTSELKQAQGNLVEEVRLFQSSLRQELSGLSSAGGNGGGNSDQILASIQSVMDQVTSQLTAQQQQMQQELFARQEADKQEILSRLQFGATDQQRSGEETQNF